MSSGPIANVSIPDYVIRPMEKGDCKSPFLLSEEGHQPLKIFFKRDAEKAGDELITRTYVAVPANGERQVLGFISIMNAEIALSKTYSIPGKPRADRYPSQPAIRIARLAVGDGLRGSGIGSDLFALALSVAVDQICPHVGCRFLITNAKRESISFYERRGFTMLDTDSNRGAPAPIMWLDLKLYQSGAVASTRADGTAEVAPIEADQAAA